VSSYRGGGAIELGARTYESYARGAPDHLDPSVGEWLGAVRRAATMGLAPHLDPEHGSIWTDGPGSDFELLADDELSPDPPPEPLGGVGAGWWWPPRPFRRLDLAAAKKCKGCARRAGQTTGAPPDTDPEDDKTPEEERQAKFKRTKPAVTGGVAFNVLVTFDWDPSKGKATEDCLFQRIKSTLWICILKAGKCKPRLDFEGAVGRGRWQPDPGKQMRDKNGKRTGFTLREAGVINGPSRDPEASGSEAGTGDAPGISISGPDVERALAWAAGGGSVVITKCSEFVTLRCKMLESGGCKLIEKREWWTVDHYKITRGAGGKYKLTGAASDPASGHASGNGPMPAKYKRKICKKPAGTGRPAGR